MKSAQALEQTLTSLDGQKYGAYKQIKDLYEFNLFKLRIDHIQVDPFAPPSKMSVVIDKPTSKISWFFIKFWTETTGCEWLLNARVS